MRCMKSTKMRQDWLLPLSRNAQSRRRADKADQRRLNPTTVGLGLIGGTVALGGLYALKRYKENAAISPGIVHEVHTKTPPAAMSGDLEDLVEPGSVHGVQHKDAGHTETPDVVELYTPDAKVRLVKAEEFGVTLPDPEKLLAGLQGKRQLILLETLSMFETSGIEHYRRLAKENLTRWASRARHEPNGSCKIEVVPGDWGEVTLGLTMKYGKCFAALNMAHASSPGGGYTKGMVAQEENMFRRTDCHFAIVRDTFMKSKKSYNDEHSDLLNGKNGKVYLDTANPRVCIRGQEEIREENGMTQLIKWYDPLPFDRVFPFYELRAAAVDLRPYDKPEEAYDHKETEKRVAAQLETLISKKVRHVVLSAFGCGAFKNPADRVARAYHEALRTRDKDFDVVAFAIFNAGYGPDNFVPFKKEFAKWSIMGPEPAPNGSPEIQP
jgi:hypothetical protein